MVKNLSTNDELSEQVLILPHPLDNTKNMSSLNIPSIGVTEGEYKCVQIAQGFEFDGTQTWAQEMTIEDYKHNQYNPLFFDLTNVPADQISTTLENLGAGPSNQDLISSIIRESSVGHLFKGFDWTSNDKIAFNEYWHRLWEYSGLGNVGALLNAVSTDKATLEGGGTITVISRDGSVLNVDKLTIAMLDYCINLCITYKKKFPDGLI